MKSRKETHIASVFRIDTIVTVYHFPLEDCASDSEASAKNAVSYDFWQLFYLEQGEGAFLLDDKEVTLFAGQLVFCEPGTIRRTLYLRSAVVGIVSFRCQSENMTLLRNTALTLTEEMQRNLARLLEIGTEVFTPVSDPQLYIGQELRAGTSDYRLQTFKNRLELLLIDLLDLRTNPPAPSALRSNQQNYYRQQFLVMEEFLKNNLHRSLRIADLCEHTGLSVNTVKRICRIFIGSGAMHHFLTLKIEKAKQLLRETDMSCTQIAEALGFSGIHYFSRLFRQRTGLSPKQYAQSAAKRD